MAYTDFSKYTVLNRHGSVQDEGLSLADAAQVVMGYDGHEYEIITRAQPK